MSKDLTGTVFADKFRIESLLKPSTTGDYYRAVNIFRDETVTLKILDEAADASHIAAFEDEGKKLKLNESPNLLRAIDSGTQDGSRYLVLEGLEDEGKLQSADSIDKGLPATTIAGIVEKISAGAHIALVSGQLQRNISNDTIFIGNWGPPKLIDTFSSPRDESEKANALQTAAPEQLTENTAPDELSTVYSAGVLLYEMLAGEPLFKGTDEEIRKEKLEGELPPPPLSGFRSDVPSHIETAIIKALSKNRESRQQSLAEFAADIAPAAAANAAAASASKPDLWKTAFIVLAGITVLALGWIYLFSGKKLDPTTQLVPDANGQPVQPIGPATGQPEQNLIAQGVSADPLATNSNSSLPPSTLPGGDNYDPWKNGGAPPPGAPRTTGGQTVNVNPNGGSIFMPPDGCIPQPSGILLCPQPITPAANTARPTPTPKTSAANTMTAPAASPTPVAPKATPTPRSTPGPKPSPVKAQPGEPSGKPKNGEDMSQ